MAAAALANALLKDFGLINEESNFEVLDAAKIRREKNRIGGKEVTGRNVDQIECIGLDGKKDKKSKVLKKSIIDGEQYITRTTDNIEHYSYTIESGI
jgi:hypothetical protein